MCMPKREYARRQQAERDDWWTTVWREAQQRTDIRVYAIDFFGWTR